MAIIIAGGKVFNTKAELREYCKFLLNTEPYGLLQGNAFEVINDVLNMHHRYQEKVGYGTYNIGIRPCTVNRRNNQFYILRDDGTDTDFSYYKCLQSISKESTLKRALRHVVKYQLINYKTKYYKDNAKNNYVICPVTKLKVKRNESHLDHYPLQFEELVSDWMVSNELTMKDIKIKPDGDNSVSWLLEDESYIESFYKYHQEHATYRVVLNKVNLQRERAKVKLK